MTDAKQTKCPHCGSTFRISDAQLAAKGGSVRCGSCLQVFRADLHLVGATPAPAPAKPAPAAPPKPKKKGAGQDESWALELIGEDGKPAAGEDSDDGFGFDDDEIDAFIQSEEATPIPEGGPKSVRFDDELHDMLDEAGDGLPGDDNRAQATNENADESWAQSILSELEDEAKKKEHKKYGMELVDDKDKKAPKNPKLAAALGHQPTDAEDDVFAALNAGPTPVGSKPKAAAPRPADDFLGDDADVLSFLDEDPLSTPGAAAAVPPPPPISESNPFSLDRPLAHVDAPVVLKPRRAPIDWGRLFTWTFLCLIALAMFAGQYLYFNFETLAVKPNTRPMLEKACAELGCRLPDIPDPSRLKVQELVVRKHPKADAALLVDALLKNDAPFAQPFPLLHLRFRNRSDEVIASRLLRPGEYLAGEAALMRRMPPQTPVRISLPIVDPGAEAVSYSLDPVL